MELSELCGLKSCEDSIKESGLPVYIYGMGNGGEKVLKWCSDRGIKAEGVFASDDFVRGQSFMGYRVQKLSDIEREVGEFTVLCAFGTELPEIMAHIDEIERRHPLYAPDVPVAGDESFTKAGLMERFADVQRVYDALADEQSKRVFTGLSAYKITGRLGYLREIFTDEPKPSPLLGLSSDEIVCDLGAYNGDTVLGLLKATGGCKKVYAVEPEKRNFQKCVKNCTDVSEAEFYNAAAWSHDGVLDFEGGSGRQAKLETGGSGKIAARSLDSILSGRKCTYIKYDVEGADIPALEGSCETIRQYHPKLYCSLYHRCFDYIDIPLYLMEHFEGYRYFMRQDRYYPAWETYLVAVDE